MTHRISDKHCFHCCLHSLGHGGTVDGPYQWIHKLSIFTAYLLAQETDFWMFFLGGGWKL